MTTRDELHELIDALGTDELQEAAAVLEEAAASLRSLNRIAVVAHMEVAMPTSLGIGHSGRRDLSTRADELLAEGGFGR